MSDNEAPIETPIEAPIQHASTSLSILLTHEDKIAITRKHFENKGYRVHSGLQFGCELVLYADSVEFVHSDFCVHVLGNDNNYSDDYTDDVAAASCGININSVRLNWMTIQILVRAMPDLHKTLIIANVKQVSAHTIGAIEYSLNDNNCYYYIVEEIAIASEHAPFRHNKHGSITSCINDNNCISQLQVGKQIKTTQKIQNKNNKFESNNNNP